MMKAKEWGTKTVEHDMKVMEKRKITDVGKLRALRNAGWTICKIAREFVVTESEVKRALKQEGML